MVRIMMQRSLSTSSSRRDEMKNKIVKIWKTLCFFSIFLGLLYLACSVLKFKYNDGVKPMENLYDLPENTVDVLLLGSSHMGMNVDPSMMWDEQGIAAYACWGGMQPTWNTYYYLKECLKYQKPDLVVMDTYLATNDLEYDSYENMVKNIQGIRMSENKWKAVETGVTPEYQSSILLGLPTYHYRYSELTSDDFQDFFWNKNCEIQSIPTSGDAVQKIQIMDTDTVKDTEELSEKLGNYLYKIIECCKEQDIPLLLIASPYEVKETEQKRYNKIQEIADQYGIEFLNFNNFYQEIGINTDTDFRDPGHFNDSGIKKYTTYLADYIKNHYKIQDRRTDASHIWNKKRNIQEKCAYQMEEQFLGGGLNYLDTGLKLYENPFASYTLMTKIQTDCQSDDKVFLSCFSEEEGNYRGLLIRREGEKIYVIFNALSRIEITDFGKELQLAIVKNGLNYQVYADGKQAGELTVNGLNAYNGNLLLGCQINEEGERFRYSDVQVENMEVYDVALSAEDIESWNPDKLPVPDSYQTPTAGTDADFVLSTQFEGNGYDKYLDTGVALYKDPEESWTLLTRFEKGAENGSGVYLSCYHEKEGEYRGILIRNGEPGHLSILYGTTGTDVEVDEKNPVMLAVTKEKFKYNIYVNGKLVVHDALSEAETYAGNLLLGCQETPGGEQMRFSDAHIYNMEVYKGIMPENDILKWNPSYAKEPEEKQPSSVEYELAEPFKGDGQSEYIDTGIQLYDVPEKNWSLQIKFRKMETGGIILSCFAEDPKQYRGLLISQQDRSTLSLTLGQTAKELELPPQPENEIRIEKQGISYTVYLNNEKVLEDVESGCPEYDGTLCLGCELNEKGEAFRFSETKIMQLSISERKTDS